ncbi:putative plasmid maintenance system antidote protein [Flammeovirgaceae bacterium 311]|nr:putative plasmid maintenance system antidote protein [Flammeovirgaceae bacterium 311]
MSDKYRDIDALLNGIVQPEKQTLKELFDRKIHELKLTPTSAYDIIGIQSRSAKGILSGTQKVVDITSLIKIANFLQIPKEDLVKLYLETVEENFPINNITPDKINFIKENFDLAVLRKAGLIKNITDFAHIEARILSRLGLRSIFEYRKPNIDVAFSSGLFKQKNDNTRAFWIKAAQAYLKEIDNPYEYNREQLIKVFPRIRWHTLNEEKGLVEVIKILYRVGITVIFQPPLQKLQLRGATFNHKNKPCIVLTNYLGFYATLWFALIHELYHVLFDWEEIKVNKYHLTDDSNEQLSVREREAEADKFAREYLFSTEKTKNIRPYIYDESFVKNYASDNHVHPSIIYVFNAWDQKNNRGWALARKHSPDVNKSVISIKTDWQDEDPIEKITTKHKAEAYN